MRSLASGLLTSAPPNVKINNSSGDAAPATQSEESVAALGDQVVVAWNDGQGSFTGGAYQGFAWSNDAGQTWVDGGDPPRPATHPQFRWMSDPVLTVNEKTGTFYYCAMANTDLSHNGLAVARGSFTGGVFAWQDVRVVREVTNNAAYLDKPWIVADSSGTGTWVYLSNTTFSPSGNQIDFYRSTDGGVTWSNPQKLSSNADGNGRVQASRPTVGPNGELYVVWYAIGQTTAEDFMRLRRSTNRGQSFAAEETVTDFIANFGTGSPGYNRDRGIHFPSIAVDRTNGAYRGRVYVAWTEAYNFQDDPLSTGTSRVETEPNGFPAAGTPFTPGDVLRGATASVSPEDQDYWSFSLAEGQSIVVWADSLPASQTYALRVFAGGADTLQSLCFGGDFIPGSSVSQAFYTFTAPVSSTYTLRMGPIDGGSVAGGYRVRTGVGVRGSERGRDQRDVFVRWSSPGSPWSAAQRVNDDKVGLDDYFAEVGIGADGCPYVTWADFRDQPFGATAHRYLSRSHDGGATWAANQRATGVATNWYYTASNLAPNMGDYSGITSGTRWLYLAWSDGRDASADVYGTRLDLWPSIAGCAPAVSAPPGATVDLTWTLGNGNSLFASACTATLTASRAWPLPTAATATVPAEGTSDIGFTVQVPDTASPGDVTLTLVSSPAPGVLAATCATTITVTNPVAVEGGPSALWLGPSVPNPARGAATLAFALPSPARAALRIYGVRGELVRTLVEGDLAAGTHRARWDGRDDRGGVAPAGTYFYRMETPAGTLTRRLVWLR